MIQSKEQIFEELGRHRQALSRFGVRSYGLFGSFVRSQQNEESDIDLLVDFDPAKKSFENFMNLAFFLEDLFGRKVDLITRESLSPRFGPRILPEIEYGIVD